MAMSIMNNVTSLGATNYTNIANNKLTKTIQQLSSGYRINSASDDASGLAVSEKLRGQIRGLSKAAANAQDGISMLQTAEGAISNITDIVQRMREIAVQAGDPAYTTNDRAMLQLEVDQLKQEVNRVSTATEFNTKKLLNGDAAALWSSTTGTVEAVVKGEVAEGNYKLTYSVDPGANAVYKSDVMDVKDGVTSYDVIENSTAIEKISNIIDMKAEDGFRINVKATSAGVTAASNVIGTTNQGAWKVAVAQEAAASAQATNSYVMEIKATSDREADGTGTVKFRVQNSKTGELSDWISGNIGASGVMTATNKDDLKNVAGLGKNAIFQNSVGVTLGATTAATATSGKLALSKDDTILVAVTVKVDAGSKTTAVQAGNRGAVLNYNTSDLVNSNYEKTTTLYTAQMDDAGNVYYGRLDATFSREPDDYTQKDVTNVIYTAGTVIKAGTVLDIGATATATVMFEGAASGTSVTAGNYLPKGTVIASGADTGLVPPGATSAATLANGAATVKNGVILGANSAVSTTMVSGPKLFQDGKVTAEVKTTKGGSMKMDIIGSGDVASKYTRLADIARFINADGRNVLDNTQELTVYNGRGGEYVMTLEGSDTVGDFEQKLTDALIALGMGGDINNVSANDVNRNLVNFVGRGDGLKNSNEAVEGTFVIQSALMGKDSQISFSGDQGVIDALSLAQIQQEEDAALYVRVNDAHSGAFIGEDTVTDNRLRNVIKGADVVITPEPAANISYDATTRKMIFAAKSEPETAYLHIVNNATKAAIGANEGQVFDMAIGRMDTTSLEIDDVNVVTFDNAQKSITRLDQALEKISKSRATIGAQINRLDYTISNLNTMKENLTASESRIRDLDIAQATADLAARQVLLQSATAMLAQANQMPSYAAQLLK